MSIIRPFEPTDILRFNNVNADAWTATYSSGYYSSYLIQWPDWCMTAVGAFDSGVKAYMIGKHEPPAPDPQHHAHLTALSIAPPYRSLGLARLFMDHLEVLASDGKGGSSSTSSTPRPKQSAKLKSATAGPPEIESANVDKRLDTVDAWFVDLFVRCNNNRAVEMYERLGYSVYRRVVDYYVGMEENPTRDQLDGYDMRKSTSKDTTKRYVRPNGRDILVSPEDVWA